jgi:hypothetical protein
LRESVGREIGVAVHEIQAVVTAFDDDDQVLQPL